MKLLWQSLSRIGLIPMLVAQISQEQLSQACGVATAHFIVVGMAKIRKGIQLAQETCLIFNGIVSGVQRVAEVIHEISGSYPEQSQVSCHIAERPQSIAYLIQPNERSIEQVAYAT
ncbi:MAG: hypothetical protein ACPGYT_00200 [Nitrospirales bacterium]